MRWLEVGEAELGMVETMHKAVARIRGRVSSSNGNQRGKFLKTHVAVFCYRLTRSVEGCKY